MPRYEVDVILGTLGVTLLTIAAALAYDLVANLL